MGKRIISQARGKGGPAYRAKKSAFRFRIGYPMQDGNALILGILHSAGHSAPLMKVSINKEVFFNPAFNGAYIGQTIVVGKGSIENGNITMLKDILLGKRVYNIERNPGDGGKMIRAAGLSAVVFKKYPHNKISVLMPNKKEVILSGNCRVTIGEIAGSGRNLKPFVTAGKRFYKMKAKNKLWPRTSAVKMNAVDHPFGSGRGKRIKSKIAQRNAPAGRRVGHIRPSRTGRRK